MGIDQTAGADDRRLLDRAWAGDTAAMGVLIDRYQHVVYRFALAMAGATDTAEDITQEVFVVLMGQRRRYDPARSALSTYLYGIARNLSRERIRRAKRWLPLDILRGTAAEAATAGADPFHDIAAARAGADLRKALTTLPVKYREVVILCDLHDLSYSAAANAVNTSVGAVRSRLHRGRHLLRERLRAAEGVIDATTRPVRHLT